MFTKRWTAFGVSFGLFLILVGTLATAGNEPDGVHVFLIGMILTGISVLTRRSV